MEINFTLVRTVILVLLVAGFWFFDGFVPPSSIITDGHHSGADRSWMYCVLMFLGGAVSATIVDHHVGNIDRSNIRIAYVFIGVILMIASALWLRGVQQTVRTETQEAAWWTNRACLEDA